jgi:hypothetical protein
MVSRVTELHAALAQREEAEARAVRAHADADAASARSRALEQELRRQLAAPVGEALEGLCRALAEASAGRNTVPGPGAGVESAPAPLSSTPTETA